MNLYTNILRRHLKSRIKESIIASQRRMEVKGISILFIGRDKSYFVKSNSISNNKH